MKALSVLIAVLLLRALPGCTQINPDYDPRSLGDLAGGPSIDGQVPADLAGLDLAGLDLARQDLAGQDLALDHHDLSSAPDLSLPPDLRLPTETCTTRFGSAPAFMSCAESPTSCRFYVKNAEKASCAAVCAISFGSVCLGAWDVDSLSCSTAGLAQVPCTEQHHDKICECSKL